MEKKEVEMSRRSRGRTIAIRLLEELTKGEDPADFATVKEGKSRSRIPHALWKLDPTAVERSMSGLIHAGVPCSGVGGFA
ncbi:unnamed protein product [Linum trigynum]|uniref:Uncharacterized protein n=1 Tax=Linum trigynum TaxID=586398 RepID=A0AAV2CFZ9_9ROSI